MARLSGGGGGWESWRAEEDAREAQAKSAPPAPPPRPVAKLTPVTMAEGSLLLEKGAPLPAGRCLPHGMSWADLTVLHAVGSALGKEMAERDAENAALREQIEQLQERIDAGGALPKWTPGIHRQNARVQAYLGQTFKALRDTADAPGGDSPDWVRVGSAGMRVRGGFSPSERYADGDIITRDFSTLLCLDGELHLMSARGAKGEAGPRGLSGLCAEVVRARVVGSLLMIDVKDARGERVVSASLAPLVSELAAAVQQAQYGARRNAAEDARP